MISYRKIGGLRFLRIGRLQISWCVTKPKTEQDRVAEMQRAVKRYELARAGRRWFSSKPQQRRAFFAARAAQ
jgi:hypothetical protein